MTTVATIISLPFERFGRGLKEAGARALEVTASVRAAVRTTVAGARHRNGEGPIAAETLTARAPLGRLVFGRGVSLVGRAGIMALAASGLAIGGLEVAAAMLKAGEPAREPAPDAVRPSAWIDINRPIPVYDLSGTDFAKLPLVYRARRRPGDGTREDILTYGTLAGPKPYLQLSLTRRGSSATGSAVEGGSTSLGDDLAGLAATGRETLSRIRPALPVETRLGTVEAADLLVWDGASSTPCLGFRTVAAAGAVLRVAGVACGAPGHALGRAALACAVDRIDLLSAGEDAPLREVFVAAERRAGSACDAVTGPALANTDLLGASGLLAMAVRRGSWLDPSADLPPLRGLIDTTNRKR